MPGSCRRRALLAILLAWLAPITAIAGDSPGPSVTPTSEPAVETLPADQLPPDRSAWDIKFSLFTGAQTSILTGSFWGLDDVFAPAADFANDRAWSELWAVPGVTLTFAPTDTVSLYGGLAVAATGNLGRDVFDQGNAGRVSLETACLGMKLHNDTDQWSIDLSGGQQPYRLGTGMLIDLGAQNGNQRGAGLVAPRKSWEHTGILRTTLHRVAADVFALNYNEITSADADTTLVGAKLELDLSSDPVLAKEMIGIAYFAAVDSTMPYIRAPLELIEDGRDGTQTVDAYTRFRPLRTAMPGLYLAMEGAYQWNDDQDLSAYAFSTELGHQWLDAPLRPKLSYAFRRFSGDDPATADLERFDPMFYDGGVHAFATGSNAALTFYNSNVQAHRVSLNLSLTRGDMVTLSYWRVEAVEVNSPIQFGQAGRLEQIDGQLVLVSGVPTSHLSDDLYVEYVRVLSPNAFLTLGAAISFPGTGLEEQADQSLDPWIGLLVNLSFQF